MTYTVTRPERPHRTDPRYASVRLQAQAHPVRQSATSLLALVLAGGRGSRLGPLTSWRAKPALPFGGRYRIIDFVLSNCLHSGLRRVGVLTQYLGQSLLPHLDDVWGAFGDELGPFIEHLPAPEGTAHGYSGTADAVHQNRRLIRAHDPSHTLILAADHVYRMDYRAMLAHHQRTHALLTVGCVEVPLAQAAAFGIMQTDASGHITGFAEKPEHVLPMPGRPGTTLASMGIYLFDTGYLLALLERDADMRGSRHDFGKDVIPAAVAAGNAYAYNLRDLASDGFQGYWRDVGTIDAYWRCSMELIGEQALFDPGHAAWPIWNPADLDAGRRAAKPTAGGNLDLSRHRAADSRVRHSIMFPNVTLGSRCRVDDSVILPCVTLEPGCVVRKAIIDDGCRVPQGTVIGVDAACDRKHFHVTESGVTLVTPEMLARHVRTG